MLVTFSCEAYENITMFGEVAKRLLTLMGHSATVPGALKAEEIPDALARLENGIAQTRLQNTPSVQSDDDEEPPISLATRAVPLINMLKAASKNKCSVIWK
ncbi:DUF1840 domain-containing protein [Legionella fairfieldensis]|uniref:DUF1840 domain-containing protein n=1 Tax=Legionella fairfieldensis TaxID=45064 RepID=UPI00048D213B|nr:DUF1840 domain-containing protein [Legionella fairfieldensis]